MAKAKFTSPKGTAMWPWLSKPDTRFDAEGKYKSDLLVKKEDAKEIVYGMPHSIWKEKYQTEASEKQSNDFKNKETKAH